MTDAGRSLVADVIACEKNLLVWGRALPDGTGLPPVLAPRKAAKAAMVSGVHANWGIEVGVKEAGPAACPA